MCAIIADSLMSTSNEICGGFFGTHHEARSTAVYASAIRYTCAYKFTARVKSRAYIVYGRNAVYIYTGPDLVSMQVEDVCQKFRSLEELEGNDWRQPQMMEKNRNKKRAKVYYVVLVIYSLSIYVLYLLSI